MKDFTYNSVSANYSNNELSLSPIKLPKIMKKITVVIIAKGPTKEVVMTT